MYLLVTEKDSAALKRWEFTYLLISLFCLLFGAVYERFSHGVYSPFMLYAFAVPLVGGTLICFLIDYLAVRTMPGRVPFNLYNSGVAALTVGSVLQGVVEIYGTTNRLILVYLYLGAALLWLGVLTYGAGVLFSGDR